MITDWKPYIPEFSHPIGTVTDVDFKYKISDNDCIVWGRWRNGTVHAGLPSITLPKDIVPDTNTLNEETLLGCGFRDQSKDVDYYMKLKKNRVYFENDYNILANGIFATTEFQSINFILPIKILEAE